jgi:hypothetical protein
MKEREAELNNWMTVIKGEYKEMPGLQLTKPQAQRLWGLDASTCDVLLETLRAAGFLRVTPRGCYVLDETRVERSRVGRGTCQIPEEEAIACV